MKKALISTILLFTILTSFSQEKMENLKILWPEEYQWKIGTNQEDGSVHMIEVIPGKETIENWTIIGTMMSIKGAHKFPVEKAMNLMYDEAKKNAPKANLTVIEKDETAKNPWILFKIESPKFKNDKVPESQLYYIIQGETSLYSNFVAIKEKSLSPEFIEKWTKVFKASEFVYQ